MKRRGIQLEAVRKKAVKITSLHDNQTLVYQKIIITIIYINLLKK